MGRTIIDSHAHLGWESFKDDQAEVIARARDSGVVQIVQAGVDLAGIPKQLELAQQYSFIYNGVGLHPHEAKLWDADSEFVLKESSKHPSVVGIGECGLDYFYKHSDPDVQKKVFRQQVRIARELSLPVIVHTRDAWEDTFEILRSEGRGQLRGVFHCFTGSPQEIPAIKELDFFVSFSGILTFGNAKPIQAAAPLVDAGRICVETDCPYLAPAGHRGKRNEPSFVWSTAQRLAELRRVDLDELSEQVSRNARDLFGLPVPVLT